MRNRGGRLARLEAALLPPRHDPGVGKVVITSFDRWPEPDRAAYAEAAARGDRVAMADAVERATGERPAYSPRMLVSVIVAPAPSARGSS